MNWNLRLWLTQLLLILCSATAQTSAFASIFIVDHNATPCLRIGTHLTTIQAAVNAAAPGSEVGVCPGTYLEQVTINKSLILSGIRLLSANGGAGASASTIAVSSASLMAGPDGTWAPQVLVTAPNVTIENLEVDGSNAAPNGCLVPDIAGIEFAAGSSGIVNHVALYNQASTFFGSFAYEQYCGAGVVVDAGASGLVTIKNSSLRAVGQDAYILANSPVAVTNNLLTGPGPTGLANIMSTQGTGIIVNAGSTVTGNIVTNVGLGIVCNSSTCSSNTVSGTQGILAGPSMAGGPPSTVSGNTVTGYGYGGGTNTLGGVGIITTGGTISDNRISGFNQAISVSNEFASSSSTLSDNMISDAQYGINRNFNSNVTVNEFYNVTQIYD